MSIYAVMFYGLGAVIVAATALAITRRNLMHAIVYLVLSFIGTAMLFYLLGAPFLAVLEVVIYAGAIMVLFLFVIMLLNIRQPEADPKIPFIGQKLAGIILAGFTGLILIYGVTKAALTTGKEMAPGLGNTESIARSLFTDYLLPFEVTSVLLLVAIVGAVVLAKSKLK